MKTVDWWQAQCETLERENKELKARIAMLEEDLENGMMNPGEDDRD